MKLNLTTEQIVGLMEMYNGDHATEFNLLTVNDDYYYLTAIAGKFSEDHEPGTKMMFRVERKSNYEADGAHDYAVFASVQTGWEDHPDGGWRWQFDLGIDPMAYKESRTLGSILEDFGLVLDEEALKAVGLTWVNNQTTIHGVNGWINGARPDFINPITLGALARINGALRLKQ